MKMKNHLFLLIVILLVLLTSSTSSLAVSEEEKKEENNASVVFSIPANTFCDRSQPVVMSLNISNLSNKSAKIKLDLSRNDGTAFTGEGSSYNGITSTLVPGSSIEVDALKTITYHVTFGGQQDNCDDRPFFGRITGETDGISFVASGFVSSSLGSIPIIINNGSPWDVSIKEPIEPEPNPEPEETIPIDSCSITNKESLIHAMTTNISEYGTASSSSYDNSKWDSQPYKAFDNTCSPFATAYGQTTGWLEYSFKEAKTVTKYSIHMKQNDANHGYGQSPNSWVFEAFNGTDWVALDTQSNITKWSESTPNEYMIVEPGSYERYRIRFTKNNGGALITISELGMIGY